VWEVRDSVDVPTMGRQVVAVVDVAEGGVIAMRWEVGVVIGAVGKTVGRDRWQGASSRGKSLQGGEEKPVFDRKYQVGSGSGWFGCNIVRQ